LSTPKSRTRSCISWAGLKVAGRSPDQPVAGVGAAAGNGAWPAYPAGVSNWSPNEAMNGASSNSASPGLPDEVRRHAATGEEGLEVDRGAGPGSTQAVEACRRADAVVLGGAGSPMLHGRTGPASWRGALASVWDGGALASVWDGLTGLRSFRGGLGFAR
jgi:hypothetical protein